MSNIIKNKEEIFISKVIDSLNDEINYNNLPHFMWSRYETKYYLECSCSNKKIFYLIFIERNNHMNFYTKCLKWAHTYELDRETKIIRKFEIFDENIFNFINKLPKIIRTYKILK